jgi:hypothetical protein
MATPILPRPTADEVIKAEKKFDQENGPVEWVLRQLFEKFPENTDLREVAVKTKVLNVLYGLQILAVNVVAKHITDLGIDPDLRAGKAEIVDRIAEARLSGDKIRHYFSFASKYCSWHNPTKYPIYDSNVEACLWHYKNQEGSRFAAALADRVIAFPRYGYDYAGFVRIVNAFRDGYGLTSFTYKQLDKLLWSLGDTLLSRGKAT